MQLAPRAKDWPDFVNVTGYWTIPPQKVEFTLPQEVQSFLDAGSPPVYMGFGSMPIKDTKVYLLAIVPSLHVSLQCYRYLAGDSETFCRGSDAVGDERHTLFWLGELGKLCRSS